MKSDASHARSARAGEAGVSLLELVVVLLIVGILIALLLGRMETAQDTSAKSMGRGVARAYHDAAGDFASDNGGSVPVPGTPNWPTATLQQGPINHLNVNTQQRYMARVPEALSDGRVRLVTDGGSAGPASAPVVVRYRVTGAQTFEITAERRGTPYCRIANGPSGSSLPEC